MSFPYSMYCTVCKNDYDNKHEWLRHLTNPEHQDLAREECFNLWREDETVRDCVVTVFCSFSLTYPGTVTELLDRFSGGGGGEAVMDIVTDFVWWPERPRVGYMQFESGEKVTQILMSLEEGCNGFVENKLIQLKRATDILKLEWNELLHPLISGNNHNIMSFGSEVTQGSSPMPLEEKPTSNSTLPPSITEADTAPIPVPASISIENPQGPLQLQCNSIFKSVEIPEDEFNHSLEIVNVIKKLLQRDHPSGQVIMFRNYYLRLRNTSSHNVLLLYTYVEDNPMDPNLFLAIGKTIRLAIFDSPEFHNRLPGFKSKSFTNCPVGGSPYQHEASGFQFNFCTDPLAMPEVQLCRLFQYMCTFDPRTRPLLSLVYFWAKSHSVQIAEKDIPKYLHCSNCPEPVALEWLVMLFLIHEGIVPSVRRILERPHKPLLINEVRNDIGFSSDPEFVQQWKHSKCSPPFNSEEFLKSVITLAHKLFRFYSSHLEDGCWLLNPKDGELIRREGTHCHKSKLVPEETHALNVVQNSEFSKPHLIITNSRIHFLNPLYLTRRLSFCVETWTNSTCGKMKKTADDLEEYLKLIDTSVTCEGGSSQLPTLEGVLAGGKKKSENVKLDMQCENNQNLRKAIRTRVEQRKRQGGSGSDAEPEGKREKR